MRITEQNETSSFIAGWQRLRLTDDHGKTVTQVKCKGEKSEGGNYEEAESGVWKESDIHTNVPQFLRLCNLVAQKVNFTDTNVSQSSSGQRVMDSWRKSPQCNT